MKPWKTDDVAKLEVLIGQLGFSYADAAKRLGRSRSSVAVKWLSINGIYDQRQDHRKPTAKADFEQRRCLKCREFFTSDWRGNRICTACKSQDSWVSQNSVMGE